MEIAIHVSGEGTDSSNEVYRSNVYGTKGLLHNWDIEYTSISKLTTGIEILVGTCSIIWPNAYSGRFLIVGKTGDSKVVYGAWGSELPFSIGSDKNLY